MCTTLVLAIQHCGHGHRIHDVMSSRSGTPHACAAPAVPIALSSPHGSANVWLLWPWSLPLADPVVVGHTLGQADATAAAVRATWRFSHRTSHLPRSSCHPPLSRRVTAFIVVLMLFPRACCSATAARSWPRPSNPISTPHGMLPLSLTVWVFLLI